MVYESVSYWMVFGQLKTTVQITRERRFKDLCIVNVDDPWRLAQRCGMRQWDQHNLNQQRKQGSNCICMCV